MTARQAAVAAELLKCRDEAIALCEQATRLAEKVRAICTERLPEPPGRRRGHLTLLPPR
jgi:hypothetical protein